MTKYSRQREAVLKSLRAVKTHPTASEIYEMVRVNIPNISLGTVYRNLAQLAKNDHIMRITTGEGTERFDGNPEPHYHFCCQSCGRVTDIDIPLIETIEDDVFRLTGNRAQSHSLMLYGTCKTCLSAETPEQPPKQKQKAETKAKTKTKSSVVK
ncbi:transcriptional repressor [Oscillospiraceae bacterium OttesenSCG-928-G22]|nr:transcriptional repressor [Oscillospiraceae bacterium OttesenSCG-928-G22]